MTQVEALGEWTAETTLAQEDNVFNKLQRQSHLYGAVTF